MSRSCDTLTRAFLQSTNTLPIKLRDVFVDSGVRNSVTVMTIESWVSCHYGNVRYNTRHQKYTHCVFVASSYITSRSHRQSLWQKKTAQEVLWQATLRSCSIGNRLSYIIVNREVISKTTWCHCIRWQTSPFPG